MSNLQCVGKLVEKVAVKRFSNHVVKNNLDEPLQSAYKEKHSVETALIKVYDDLLCAVDNKQCIMMSLLDLSAAFDTVDHNVMFSRLEKCFGVTGKALDWVKSYFSNRYQFVSINGSKSTMHPLPYGVPQGSVFGPFSFPKYTTPLSKIAMKHNINYHLYADDSQLYVVFEVNEGPAAAKRLENCIAEIRAWMKVNMLKLNDDKTEFLVISSKHMCNKMPDVSSLRVGDSDVQAVPCARNIGVMLDNKLNMVEHVKSVCKASYMHLHNISMIRRYITEDATRTLIQSFVTSRLDNLNSLLYGLPDCVLHKLQLIQNNAAKLVVRKKKVDHITPILKSLHWLPVQQRIKFKIILLTFKCRHGLAPPYLCSLLEDYIQSRTLRSTGQNLLKEKKARLHTYGDRAFSIAAPRLWNKLPSKMRECEDIAIFRSFLKTLLFKEAYE